MLYPGQFIFPDQLEKLGRALKNVLDEVGLDAKSAEAEQIALNIMKLFMNGLTEEDELVAAAKNRSRLPHH